MSEKQSSSLCDGLEGAYSFPLHIGAIFVVLFASGFGTSLPILTKYIKVLRENPFFFIVGKTAATGVLLSVSTIHLIHESEEAFHAHCISTALTNYSAYHFLFALIAALTMQAIDLQLEATAERWMKAKGNEAPTLIDVGVAPETGGTDTSTAKQNGIVAPAVEELLPITDDDEKPRRSPQNVSITSQTRKAILSEARPHAEASHAHAHGGHDSHGHQHLTFEIPTDFSIIRKVISAVCMEFGVTLHSVFVGLAVGLTTNDELKPLLFALFFHQLFEGMALGSRLVDAKFNSKLEVSMAVVFSCSAPLGMVAATTAVFISKDAMSGTYFVTMMAVLNALCGGILLYLAFSLLLFDFAEDMKQFCADGCLNAGKRKLVLFAALWLGMLLMAFVGKWL